MRKHNLKLVSDAQALAEETKKIKIKKGLILKKRADGRSPYWFAQITVSGNHPKLITTGKTDEKEATQIAYQLQAKLNAESNAGLSIHSKSFERVAKEYVEVQKERLLNGEYAQSSFERDVKCIDNYLIPYFKSNKISIGKITKVILNDFKVWLPKNRKKTDGKMGSATRRKYEDIP